MMVTVARRLALVLAWWMVVPLAIAQAKQPNFVFVLLDNVGQEWFGCYGSREGATPTIDRLAAEGARFQHCYATPYCSTSRAVLLTGRYPHSTGWRFHHDAGIYGGGNFDWKREATFARILREAGYATCVAGKWQINNFNEPGQAECLQGHGFDEHLVTPGGKTDSKYWDPLLIENGNRSVRTGAFAPDLFTDFAEAFIRRRQKQPFLVYFPITLVHTPLPQTPRTKGKELSPVETFRENLSYADGLIARLLRTLEECQLRDDTYVIISADNGAPPSFPAQTDRGEVRGAAGTFHESSVNMPLVVNCPTKVKPGLVGLMSDYSDIAPTMIELAGWEPSQKGKFDGVSFAKWVTGREAHSPREWMHTALNDERIVRDARFKLYSSGGLFDPAADSDERVDLSAASDPTIQAARRRLQLVLDAFPPDTPLDFTPESVASRRYREDKAAGRSTLLKRSR